jgi:proteasome lid subunit RPN8/RPN11
MMKTNPALEQKTLYLPRPLVNKLLAHAQSNPEIEACGLIGNDEENEKHYYPVDNISNNPSCRFLMDAPQQISAMKKMRDKKQALFAIVHSHPTSQAIPSDLDIAENSYKNAVYIIISLNTKGVLEMRAYTQKDGSMHEVDLILEDED